MSGGRYKQPQSGIANKIDSYPQLLAKQSHLTTHKKTAVRKTPTAADFI
jgi:hypothetical protein